MSYCVYLWLFFFLPWHRKYRVSFFYTSIVSNFWFLNSALLITQLESILYSISHTGFLRRVCLSSPSQYAPCRDSFSQTPQQQEPQKTLFDCSYELLQIYIEVDLVECPFKVVETLQNSYIAKLHQYTNLHRSHNMKSYCPDGHISSRSLVQSHANAPTLTPKHSCTHMPYTCVVSESIKDSWRQMKGLKWVSVLHWITTRRPPSAASVDIWDL